MTHVEPIATERRRASTPTLRLMAAVLDDSLRLLHRTRPADGPRGRRRVAEERAWVASRNPDDLFSFESVCEYLGLDPGAIRAAVLGPQAACPSYRRARQTRLERATPRSRISVPGPRRRHRARTARPTTPPALTRTTRA
jgi:hypothetical protein